MEKKLFLLFSGATERKWDLIHSFAIKINSKTDEESRLMYIITLIIVGKTSDND